MRHAEKEGKMKGLASFLSGSAILVLTVIIVGLAVGAHFITAIATQSYEYWEGKVIFLPDQPLYSVLATGIMMMILLAALYIARLRVGRIKMLHIMVGIWTAVSVFWIWGVGMEPRSDPKWVVEAANAFAAGDYSVLRDTTYFSDFTFQMGICLLMEIIKRIFPVGDLVVVVQILNVFWTLLAMRALDLLVRLLTGNEKGGEAVYVICCLFLPAVLFCTYTYGTVPMVAISAWAMLFFVRFLRNEKMRDGLCFSVLVGLAVMAKPNAAIVVIASVIIAVLHALCTRRVYVLLYAGLGVVCSVVFPELAVWQYELRSGVELGEGLSMLAYLVVGLMEGKMAPGWFSTYAVPFSPSAMPAHEAQAIIISDLMERLAEFAADPGMCWTFMKEKFISIWLEPTHTTLHNGVISNLSGRYNGLGCLVYREDGILYQILPWIMDAWQQAMYALAAIGSICTFRRHRDVAQALLPTVLLGGILYHQLFEASSMYTHAYMFFFSLLAAQGLTALGKAADGITGRIRKIS